MNYLINLSLNKSKMRKDSLKEKKAKKRSSKVILRTRKRRTILKSSQKCQGKEVINSRSNRRWKLNHKSNRKNQNREEEEIPSSMTLLTAVRI